MKSSTLVPQQSSRLELAILAEVARRASSKPVFVSDAFPAQFAFVRDPSRFRVMLGTRRAAKSYSIALDFLEDAYEHPRANYLYIGLTRDSSKKAIWKDGLKLIAERLALDLRFNESDLTCTLPNGAVIYILGMDAGEKQVEKARGGKYRKIAIDEAQSFGVDLTALVMVLRPALADERGSLTLAGTPGSIRKGLFFDLTHDQDPQRPGRWLRGHAETAAEWSGHRWNAGVNPHMCEQWAEEIAAMIAVSPRVIETPRFIREYYGQWVLDDSNLVYRYQSGRNDYAELPQHARGRWHFGLAIDLGFAPDPSAFTVSAYHDADPCLYIEESHTQLRMDITDVAERVKAMQGAYDARGGFDSIVIDGANLQAVEEMRKRHGLPLIAADKRGKSDFIEMMNAEFTQSRIKLSPRCAVLKEEYGGLIWNDRSAKREEHPGCGNHAADSAIYGWRKAYAYLSQAPQKFPALDSAEYRAAEETRMMAMLLKGCEKQDPIDAEVDFWSR